MASSKTHIFLSFFLLLVSTTLSQIEFALYSCNLFNGNYTQTSNYKKNLNTLLSSVSSNTQLLNYGFYNFSTGQGPDKVNAIALCRGDVSVEICRVCVEESTRKILELCPNQKEAIVWYNQCMIRYSNNPIFRLLDNSGPQSIFNGNSASDVNGFLGALKNLLDKLRNRAVLGDSKKKFAAGEKATGNETIFAFVQCTPDLTSGDCDKCVSEIGALISEARIGARIFSASCILRYETNQFYSSPPRRL